MIVTGDEIGKWVSDKIGSIWFKEGTYCIGDLRDTLVSGAIFEKYNGSSVVVSIATEKSFSKEFVKKIHELPFDILRVNCVICQVSSSNLKSIKLLNHLGFKMNCHISNAMNDGDMCIYSLSSQDRKFGAKNGKHS